MTVTDDSYLIHYGILRRSGRYPWGSGEHKGPEYNTGPGSFLGYVDQLAKEGLSQVEIAKGLGTTTTALRAARSIAKNEVHAAQVAHAVRLKNKGLSNVAIAQRMGINESSVRALIKSSEQQKANILAATSNLLKEKVDTGAYLDIGSGTESHLGISATKLATAVALLREQGYEVHNVQVDQLGTGVGKKTTVKVLASPGTKYVDIVKNPHRIQTVAAYSEDGGRTFAPIKPPVNVDSKRIAVRYAEQGGSSADGVIYVRPGVPDLALGRARYAQVRIAVDGTHYLKGMAMYKDDLPSGVDLLFNTNKSDTGNKLDAMKAQKAEDNPFGATIRQRHYTGSDGKEHLSPMNIVNEEGDWRDWSRSLSSQFLSKQSIKLAQRQLDLTLNSYKDELDAIRGLTNPVVKQKLLEQFGDSADSAAVHLKAAALPRQGTHVILPIPSLKENEIHAPNYRNGEKVVLIRHPHGGTFEIPELTVNNKNADARKSIGQAIDAVGIHPKVAQRLSGADFDGDTVLVIPNSRRDVTTTSPLKGLEGFDPQRNYAPYDGMKTIDGGIYRSATKSVDYGGKKPSGQAKQQQMGDISNLITDMTIRGAKSEEIAAAVRHSMVVIDAEKHSLNVKQSRLDNGIDKLKERYQGRGPTGRLAGASTIISRAGSEVRVPNRRPLSAGKGGSINPKTGEKQYELTGDTYTNRAGKLVVKTVPSARLAETRNARELSSGMPIENIYATHSNALKSLANTARKESLRAGAITYSPSAAETYKSEVAQLNHDLTLALRNKPLERQAQLIANTIVAAKRESNPGMDAPDLKKVKGQALDTARRRVGASKPLIPITDRQWEAIQAGAIRTTKLRQILNNAEPDRVRELATPRTATVVTPSKLAIAKARLAAGYTQAEVADSLGIPVSTLNSALHRKEDNSG